jgi:hypothetical protein
MIVFGPGKSSISYYFCLLTALQRRTVVHLVHKSQKKMRSDGEGVTETEENRGCGERKEKGDAGGR